MLLWDMYIVGCLLQLALQIQNSIRSKSNGVETGWQGIVHWLRLSLLSVMIRQFFAVIMFPAIIQGPLTKLTGPLQAAGFPIPPWGIAGIFGYANGEFLNRLAGLIPGLRVEIPQLVPPDPSDTPPQPISKPPGGGL